MEAQSPDTRPAGFWIRAAASVLDSIVILGGLAVLGVLRIVVEVLTTANPTTVNTVFVVVVHAAAITYLARTESSGRRATLGKRALGLTVTDLAGRRVSFERALRRAVAKYLNTLTLGLGWLLAGLTPRKRGLHDLLTGTMVRRPAGPVPTAWLIVAATVGAGVPLAGVVAGIAVPTLLRASMAQNEEAAIAALRAIRAAQQHHLQDCRGYAVSLTALAVPRPYLEPALTASDTVEHMGYMIAMASAPGSAMRDTAEGCRNTVSAYVVQAAPLTPSVTGTRYFVMEDNGVIYETERANPAARRRVE